MNHWLAARWQAFLASFDPDEIISQSSPSGTVGAAGALALVFLVVGLVPPLRRLSMATATLPCVVLALTGGAMTHLAYRARCRGTLGSIATLLDNSCYATSLSLAALTTARGFGIGFAVVQALMVVAFPATAYGFGLLMTVVLSAPTLAAVVLARRGRDGNARLDRLVRDVVVDDGQSAEASRALGRRQAAAA